MLNMKPSTILLAATASIASAADTVKYAGVNIAGLTFGTDTLGTTILSKLVDPGLTGIAQMQHFVSDNGLNAFRLPVSWQYLIGNDIEGKLDPVNWATYDGLVQGCLSSGAEMCVVDVHNYARWNDSIVAQGGPTDAQFSSLWSQIASKYADTPKVVFGIMNEPHNINVTQWGTTVQAAVTAIRQAHAVNQTILLPGNNWTHVSDLVSGGSADTLNNVTNLDGTTDGLVFDIHQYLDLNNTGTDATCVTNNSDVFSALGGWLRTNKRQALLTETGGGPTDDTCLQLLCEQFDTINDYSDVYLGWIGWSAGAFDTDYVLSMTPTLEGTTWKNQPLVDQCLVAKFKSDS